MDLARHYFITDDLNDLDLLEDELLASGISLPQTHVLSRQNSEVSRHERLNSVSSLMKRDVVHSAIVGATLGVFTALIILVVAYFAGWTNTAAGWLPFIMFALIVLGFSTWLGGLRGIQLPNHHFLRFQEVLNQGRHVFFVDLDHTQEKILNTISSRHPKLEFAGTGQSMAPWLLEFERKTNHWWYWRMWRNA